MRCQTWLLRVLGFTAPMAMGCSPQEHDCNVYVSSTAHHEVQDIADDEPTAFGTANELLQGLQGSTQLLATSGSQTEEMTLSMQRNTAIATFTTCETSQAPEVGPDECVAGYLGVGVVCTHGLFVPVAVTLTMEDGTEMVFDADLSAQDLNLDAADPALVVLAADELKLRHGDDGWEGTWDEAGNSWSVVSLP